MPLPVISVWRCSGCWVGLQGPAAIIDVVLSRVAVVSTMPAAVPQRTWSAVPVAGGLKVEVDGDEIGWWPTSAEATQALTSDLELWVAEHAPRRVFIHAACVAVAGQAVIIPGRSMAGKSTLAAALVRAGAVYYSDEYAVLDSSGHVHPYPRPLGLRDPARNGSLPVSTPVGDLGGTAGKGAVPVALVAALTYRAGAKLEVEPLGPGSVVLTLLENAVAARSRPRAVFNAVGRAVTTCRGVGGVRGEAADAAAPIIDMVGRSGDRNR